MPIERLYLDEKDRKYHVIAGDVGAWEEEMKRLVENGQSLPSVQEDQYNRGFRQVEIIKVGSQFKAVLVINPKKEDGTIVRKGGLRSVIEQAKHWAQRDEKSREVIIRKSLIKEMGEDIHVQ